MNPPVIEREQPILELPILDRISSIITEDMIKRSDIMGFVFPNDEDEKTLNILTDYRMNLENDPCNSSKKWPKEWFEEMSYSRWATDEIIKYVQDHLGSQSAIRSVHEIYQLFLDYSCDGDAANPSEPMWIFQIAEHTANCILDILYAYDVYE